MKVSKQLILLLNYQTDCQINLQDLLDKFEISRKSQAARHLPPSLNSVIMKLYLCWPVPSAVAMIVLFSGSGTQQSSTDPVCEEGLGHGHT